MWLVLCVMLMSSWEDGFADTGDLASDHHGGIGHPRSVVSRCDAEALGGAKTEVRGLVTKLYSMVKEENIPNKILNIHSLLAMQDLPSSEAMSEYLYKRITSAMSMHCGGAMRRRLVELCADLEQLLVSCGVLFTCGLSSM